MSNKLPSAWLMLSILFILSSIDGAATALGIHREFYAEMNPFMDLALAHGIPTFLIAKTTLVTVCCIFLYKLWHYDITRYGTYIAIGVYTLVNIGHTIMYLMLDNLGVSLF